MTRINHNISSMITRSALMRAEDSLSSSLEKLSTGLRVNRAADDAAGLSVSEQLRTQVRGTNMAVRNAGDGTALLRIAEGAANEVSSMLQRMRELSIQAGNDTLTSVERGYLDQEFQSLKSEIGRISMSTQYNGLTLLDGGVNSFGSAGGNASILHIGANNTFGVDKIRVSITAISIGSLGLSGTALTNHASINFSLDAVDSAIQQVNQMRSGVGALMNRLDHAITNLQVQETNMQSAESVIRDTDFALQSTEFTRNQILSQSSTSMLAQANTVPQGILSLFG